MTVKISVIVAVYNPGRYIDELIESLLGQSLPDDEYEVIFVDDDSTDGTRARVEQLAGEHDNIRSFHNTPNSGWPGKPRNIGIDAARGEYVFFADHDDWLPDQSLERMWDFATANDSDLVIAKEVGHGHTVPWTLFLENIPRAELGKDPLLRLLTPHKLFRKSMLDEHGIRFPEGKVRLEDHLFVTKALFAADVISLYSDYACYHWVHRDDQNASLRGVDPVAYYKDLEKVLDVVEANTEPGPLRNTLYGQWYRLKMVGWLSGEKYAKHPEPQRRKLFDTIRPIVLARFDDSMDEALDHALRVRAHLLRTDRFDLISQLAELERKATSEVTLDELAWRDGVLTVAASAVLTYQDGTPMPFDRDGDRISRVLPAEFEGAVPADILDVTEALDAVTVRLTLRDRATNELWDAPGTATHGLVPAGGHSAMRGTVTAQIDPAAAFDGRGLPAVTDVMIRFTAVGFGSQRRVPFDPDVAARGGGPRLRGGGVDLTAYGTAGYDKLSIRKSATPTPKPVPAPASAPPAPSGPAARARRLAGRIRRRLTRARRRRALP